jgi:signal peptidase I
MVGGIALGSLIGALLYGSMALAFLGMRLYTIPASSMEPTLLVGDTIFALCFDTACRLKDVMTLPSAAVSEPQQGDVATFQKPSDPDVHYVKRIVGMPGDSVEMRAGVLYLNGKAIPKVQAEDYSERDHDGKLHNVSKYVETLPNGVSYQVLDREPEGVLDTTSAFVVPAGHYFMMGDNRDNSSDSRDPNGGVGFVPRANMIARARWVTYSTLKPNRLFMPVDFSQKAAR